jgi:hypothetical protein
MGRRPFPSSYHTLPPKNPEPWSLRVALSPSPLCFFVNEVNV